MYADNVNWLFAVSVKWDKFTTTLLLSVIFVTRTCLRW